MLKVKPIILEHHPVTVHESMTRNNFLEAYQHSQGMAVPLYENPIHDARQTVMTLAKAWDDGFKWVLIQDHAKDFAICVRVSSPYLV